MLLNELAKEENKDKVFYGEINKLLPRLNEYNLGGIPLPLIVLCQKITTSNCYTISKIISDVCPDYDFVLGEVESMRNANDCNGIIKTNYNGFHAWLEKDNMVYDPVLSIFIDKDFYYTNEKVIVHSKDKQKNKKSCSKYNKFLIPTKEEPTSIFSKYRMLIILESIKPFIEQDTWIYSKALKEAFFEVYESFNKEKVKEEIKNHFPHLNKETFNDVFDELLKNKKYNEDGFQDCQASFIGLLGRQMRELSAVNQINLSSFKESPEK